MVQEHVVFAVLFDSHAPIPRHFRYRDTAVFCEFEKRSSDRETVEFRGLRKIHQILG